MKKLLKVTLFTAIWSLSLNLYAQYCTPPAWASGPFTGITNVTLGSLNNSSTINDGGSEVYTYWTSVDVPTLVVSTQYSISVTTQIIGFGNNSRVWIDWNQDEDFDDAGELVCTWNSHKQGILTADFTVPSDAAAGKTRMRVYTDMNEVQGHITPEPCGYLNYQNHFLKQHGEVEDYDVMISLVSGINDHSGNISQLRITSSGEHQVKIDYGITENSNVTLLVYNLAGQKIATLVDENLSKGEYQIRLSKNSLNGYSGLLFFRLNTNGNTITGKYLMK